MPSEYQERHQNGLDRNTESTIKYLRWTDFCKVHIINSVPALQKTSICSRISKACKII